MDDEAQTELKATIEARKELGPEHEEHLIAGFLDRIEQEIDRRVEQRVGHRRRGNLPLPAQIGPMIPIVIFAGIFGGTVGVVVALLAVVLLIAINALRQ